MPERRGEEEEERKKGKKKKKEAAEIESAFSTILIFRTHIHSN
jgi:hypothetical protein